MINLEYINSRFAKSGEITKEEILDYAEGTFTDVDMNNGNEVFAIKSKGAKWLLHNLKHDSLTRRQASNMKYVRNRFLEGGSAAIWSEKPIKINLNTLTIEDGLVRLYAVAFANSARAIHLPIEFIEE